MRTSFSRFSFFFITLLLAVALLGCSKPSPQEAGPSSDTTPTPTEFAGGAVVTPAEGQNACEGLTGTLELQLLIGPSEAVGLSPYTFATIPFQVIHEGDSYLVQGGGPVEYYEDILTADWGSFAVTFEGDTAVQGECLASDGDGTLDVIVEMVGQQTVVVTVEGMETTYPWEGSPTVEATFPLVEGAQVSGEGWNLTLHLN
jgi:hypothetical protein